MSQCFSLPTCKPRPWQTFSVPILEEDLKDSPHKPPKATHFMLSPHSTQFMPGVICVSSAPPHSVLRGCIEVCCQTQKEQVQGMPCMLVQVVCYINGAPWRWKGSLWVRSWSLISSSQVCQLVVIRSQKGPKGGARLHNLEVSCTAGAHMSAVTQDADVAVRDSQGHFYPTANVLWRPFLKGWPTVNCRKANPFTADLMPRASDVHQS